jgi:hypothetical protein
MTGLKRPEREVDYDAGKEGLPLACNTAGASWHQRDRVAGVNQPPITSVKNKMKYPALAVFVSFRII